MPLALTSTARARRNRLPRPSYARRVHLQFPKPPTASHKATALQSTPIHNYSTQPVIALSVYVGRIIIGQANWAIANVAFPNARIWGCCKVVTVFAPPKLNAHSQSALDHFAFCGFGDLGEIRSARSIAARARQDMLGVSQSPGSRSLAAMKQWLSF